MAVRNLAYELTVGGAGVAPNVVKGLFGAADTIEKLDSQAKGLRYTLIQQNTELKRMRGAGESGTEEYKMLQAAAAGTKTELGEVGQALRKAQHEQRLSTESTRKHRAMLLGAGAVVGTLVAGYAAMSNAILGVAREQRDMAHESRAAGVSFYDYTAQVHALTLALEGNAALGKANAVGLMDAARNARLFGVGLGNIDTTSLAVAGVDLNAYLEAAKDVSGLSLSRFLAEQYKSIDGISDKTERQLKLDALRMAVGDSLFALAAKQADMTEEEWAAQAALAKEQAALAEQYADALADVNQEWATMQVNLTKVKTRLAGIFGPEVARQARTFNELLSDVETAIMEVEKLKTGKYTLDMFVDTGAPPRDEPQPYFESMEDARRGPSEALPPPSRFEEAVNEGMGAVKDFFSGPIWRGVERFTGGGGWRRDEPEPAPPTGERPALAPAPVYGPPERERPAPEPALMFGPPERERPPLEPAPVAPTVEVDLGSFTGAGPREAAPGPTREPAAPVVNLYQPAAEVDLGSVASELAEAAEPQGPGAAGSAGDDFMGWTPPPSEPGERVTHNDYGGNTFYVTIDGVAGEGLAPDEAGLRTVDEIDRRLQRSTAAR